MLNRLYVHKVIHSFVLWFPFQNWNALLAKLE
ncbi:MAG: hypothetical protein ACI96N_002843, partial [Arenicella sp.]